MEQRILLNAKETSLQFFNGKRSAWSILQDAKNRKLPFIRIGRNIYFEVHSINQYIEQELEKSLSTEVVEIDGIRKIQ